MWTRRAFLQGNGLLFSAALGGMPIFLSPAVGASNNPLAFRRRRVLVAIFQRGGMDGLMAVTPFTDPNLPQMRPQLFMRPGKSKASPIDLDGRFSLHPAFSPLARFFKEGRLAIVHGVGLPVVTRSHFDAQDYMENGIPGVQQAHSGWLNRASELLGHKGSPFRAVSMTQDLPRSLYGNAPALAISDLKQFNIRVAGNQQGAEKTEARFASLYAKSSKDLLRRVVRESFGALDVLSKIDVENYNPSAGASYPNSQLGHHLKQIALLIKANVGLEITFASTGGWDTHVQQGTVNGPFALNATDLAQAISAFWTDLGAYQDDVVLITMTEFGRTVRQNGSVGTDHGRGSCVFVLGNSVIGGKVHGEVPILAIESLADRRDLPVTTDFRSVFAEVAGKHLKIKASADSVLFPGWEGERLPLIKS